MLCIRLSLRPLANKLREVLPNIISPSQITFLKGRLIIENQIISHEVIHSFKVKKKRKIMGLMLDTDKAL